MKNREKNLRMKNREIKSIQYKKFAGSVSTGQGFALQRKEETLKRYRKIGVKDRKDLEDWSKRLKKIYDEDTSDDDSTAKRKTTNIPVANDASTDSQASGQSKSKETRGVKLSKFRRLQQERERLKEEREKKKQERKVREEEKLAAVERYRKDKTRKHKLLSKKNYKGQPDMAARMQLLLERIQKQCNS